MNYEKATETKIELRENQRSDQIIDALVQVVIFPPALAQRESVADRTQPQSQLCKRYSL